MKEITYTVLFVIFTLFYSVDFTNGAWIFHRFHRSNLQPQTSDQASVQNDLNEVPSFPFFSFMDFFRPRIMEPLMQTSDKANYSHNHVSSSSVRSENTGDINTLSNFQLNTEEKISKIEDLKVNDSKSNKNTDNVTQPIPMTEVTHNIKKKMLEETSPMPFFQRIYDPLKRLRRLRYSHLEFSGNQEENKLKEKEYERRMTPGNDHLRNLNLNETSEVTERPLSTDASHDIKRKILEQPAQMSFFERIFDPFGRLHRFHYLHYKFVRKNKTDKTNETRTGFAMLENQNKTDTSMMNSSIAEPNGNCSFTHHILRYFLVWRINWASVILQVIFILLISLLVTLGVYMCQLAYSSAQPEKQHAESINIVKHLTV